MPHLFGGINHVSSSDGALVHQVIDALKLGKTDCLEGCLDDAATVEFDGLGAVLAVANVRSLDGDHLDDGLKHWSPQVGTGWQTNADDRAAWSHVLELN